MLLFFRCVVRSVAVSFLAKKETPLLGSSGRWPLQARLGGAGEDGPSVFNVQPIAGRLMKRSGTHNVRKQPNLHRSKHRQQLRRQTTHSFDCESQDRPANTSHHGSAEAHVCVSRTAQPHRGNPTPNWLNRRGSQRVEHGRALD